MDIYSRLKKDHRKVGDLMKQVLAARSAMRRKEIFMEIKEALTLHAEAEEATFYAALEQERETQEKIEHAEEDQNEIKDFLHKLSTMSVESEKWLEVFGEFKQAVEHHVKDEEERIFPKAQQVLSDTRASELGEEMERLEQEAQEAA